MVITNLNVMRNLTVFIIASMLLLGSFACTKNDTINNDLLQRIQGTWVYQSTQNNAITYQEEYTFNADHHLSIIAANVNTQNSTKRYLARQEGSYEIKNDSLIVTDSKFYFNSAKPVSTLDSLPYSTTYTRYARKVSFIQPNTLDLLPPPCGAGQDCINHVLLTRK